MIVVTGITYCELPTNPAQRYTLAQTRMPIRLSRVGDVPACNDEVEIETLYGKPFYKVMDGKETYHEIALTGEVEEFFRMPFQVLDEQKKQIENHHLVVSNLKMDIVDLEEELKKADEDLTEFKEAIKMMSFMDRLKFLFGKHPDWGK